jgi:hypothetical protein
MSKVADEAEEEPGGGEPDPEASVVDSNQGSPSSPCKSAGARPVPGRGPTASRPDGENPVGGGRGKLNGAADATAAFGSATAPAPASRGGLESRS